MSANQSATKSTVRNSLSVADRLQQQLAKIKSAERKKFLNENIVRLEKNGDLSYEAVRTYSLRVDNDEGVAVGREANHGSEPQAEDAKSKAISNSLPNTLPQTPVSQDIGNLIA